MEMSEWWKKYAPMLPAERKGAKGIFDSLCIFPAARAVKVKSNAEMEAIRTAVNQSGKRLKTPIRAENLTSPIPSLFPVTYLTA